MEQHATFSGANIGHTSILTTNSSKQQISMAIYTKMLWVVLQEKRWLLGFSLKAKISLERFTLFNHSKGQVQKKHSKYIKGTKKMQEWQLKFNQFWSKYGPTRLWSCIIHAKWITIWRILEKGRIGSLYCSIIESYITEI